MTFGFRLRTETSCPGDAVSNSTERTHGYNICWVKIIWEHSQKSFPKLNKFKWFIIILRLSVYTNCMRICLCAYIWKQSSSEEIPNEMSALIYVLSRKTNFYAPFVLIFKNRGFSSVKQKMQPFYFLKERIWRFIISFKY